MVGIGSTSATIIVNPLPTASISLSETSGPVNNDGMVYEGAVVYLTASGGGTYLWSTGNNRQHHCHTDGNHNIHSYGNQFQWMYSNSISGHYRRAESMFTSVVAIKMLHYQWRLRMASTKFGYKNRDL